MNRNSRQEACNQFLEAANYTKDISNLFPKENLTPYALMNTSNANKDLLLDALKIIPKETLLIIVLGETSPSKEILLEKTHAIFDQPFIKTFEGHISVLFIDPFLELPEGPEIQAIPIDDSLRAYNIVNMIGVKAKFPLSPVYGPHKYLDVDYFSNMRNLKNTDAMLKFQQPKVLNNIHEQLRSTFKNRVTAPSPAIPAFRRLIHKNTIKVLNDLVEYPSPVFISSRITAICYRSFKYLIDMRAILGKKTLVRYEYTNTWGGPIKTCVSAEEYALFPDPFTKCKAGMNNNSLKQFYFNTKEKPDLSNENKVLIRKSIHDMDLWANTELQKTLKGGRRTMTRKRLKR